MRAVLVPSLLYHPYSEKAYADFPLGTLMLASVLEARGWGVRVSDLNLDLLAGRLDYQRHFYDEAAEIILADDPDMVGFSSLCTSYLQAIRMAQAVKRRKPDTFIAFGGPNATFTAEFTLGEFPGLIQAVVKCEGEQVLDLMAEALEDGRDIATVPGVVTALQSGTSCATHPGLIDDLDTLPDPAWHLYPVAEGLRQGWWSGIEIEAGRGCPFPCTFCTTNLFWNRRYRVKSADRLVSEVLSLQQQFGVDNFSMVHDLFTCRKKWVDEVCETFIARGSTVNWSMSARADTLTPELIEKLGRAGCRDIYFGIETGSARMQQVVKKKLKLDSVREMVGAAQENGVRSTMSFIMGFPEEELDDLEDTLAMFCAYKLKERAQLHLLALYPGIQLVDNLDDLEFDEHVPDGALALHSEDDLELVRAHRGVFLNYYFTKTEIPRQTLKDIQAYFLATTNYLALLTAKRVFGLRLVDIALDWISRTDVTFDPSRMNVEALDAMAQDIAVDLQTIFTRRGEGALFDNICRFHRCVSEVREQAEDFHTLPYGTERPLSDSARFVATSPIKVLELDRDIPALAEAVTEGRPLDIARQKVRYAVYLNSDRVRTIRLDQVSANFLAMCLEGHALSDTYAPLGRIVTKDASADTGDLSGTVAAMRQADRMVRAGLLQAVVA